jgi:hypothetical protein
MPTRFLLAHSVDSEWLDIPGKSKGMLADGESIWRAAELDRKLYGLGRHGRPETDLSFRCLSQMMERLLASLRTGSGSGQDLC